MFVSGQYVFGFAGNFRFGQILRSIFVPPVYTGEVSIEDWMSGEFTEHLRWTVKEIGYSKNKDGRDQGGFFLVGFQSKLFLVQDEFDFCETLDGIAAIGIGGPFALGAVKALSGVGMATPDIVIRALEISAFYNGGVRAPFTIVKLGRLDGQPQPAKRGKRNTGRNRGDKAGKKTRSRRGSV